MVICLLIAYRSWSLRRVLVDPVYRSRALWTGIGGIGFLFLILALVGDGLAAARYGILADAGVAYVVAEISWGLAFLGLYGWLYTNINVSLSSDFLHRDALFWNRGGKVFFAAVLIGTYLLASIPATAAAVVAFIAAYPWFDISSIVGYIFEAMSLYAALVLFVTVRRIKDRLIKNYTKWVGLSVLGVILGIFSTSVFPSPYFFPLVLPAYIMFRAAGSLSIRTREIASE